MSPSATIGERYRAESPLPPHQLKAFKQLDIPVQDQIGILQMLHKTGKLQAKLVTD